MFFKPQYKLWTLAGVMSALLLAPVANAYHENDNSEEESNHHGDVACPVNYLNGVPLDVEFGVGSEAITHCLVKRHGAKIVVEVDSAFPLDVNGLVNKSKATFLTNLDKMIDNYEVVNGMEIGKDIDIIVVMSSNGGALLSKAHKTFGVDALGNPNPNPYAALVAKGLAKGIKFYLCQMAARELSIKRNNMLDGVEFVTGGHLAVLDLQQLGYAVVKP